MNADRIIVRLGELNLKGRNRHRFEQRVREQLQRLLKPYAAIRMSSEFGRIYLELNGEPYAPVAECLDKIFGLNSYSPAYILPLDAEQIRDQALALMKRIEPQPKTFKVRVHRANKQFPYDSIEMARYTGGYILENMEGLSVDVHNPEVEMRIDIRSNFAYVFHVVVPGTGGFPYGTNGKAMLMISGGIDSPVAGWLAMRRGLEIEAIHFHSYPYTSEKAKDKVIELTRVLSQFAPSVKLSYGAVCRHSD